MNRRHFLQGCLAGGGAMAPFYAHASKGPRHELLPHHHATAKNVIMIFLPGGCSHVDSFDPKPELRKAAEKGGKRRWMPSPWEIKPRGESGTLTTDLFPEISTHIDDITLIRSMHGDHNNHTAATLGMHTGSVTSPRPSLGAWVSYALGTKNANLPGHIVLAKEPPYSGTLAWDSNFLPAQHQGVHATPSDDPIRNLTKKYGSTQSSVLDLLGTLNETHAAPRNDSDLTARQLSFETAAAMEEAAPLVFDFSDETQETKELYGLDDPLTETFGWQCLAARRLAQSGVRFVELIDVGASDNWDAHGDIASHEPLARRIDKPISGLLTDLKRRGMMEDTLVVWCTEFGRTPWAEGDTGRNHYSTAFTTFMAGGGVKKGHVHGETCELGKEIVADGVHTHDFHATILHLLGLDHEKLTYRHDGRDFRLTDVHGHVVTDILA